MQIERLRDVQVQQQRRPARQTVLCFWRRKTKGDGGSARVHQSNDNDQIPFPTKQLFDYDGVDGLRAEQRALVTCTLDPQRHLAIARSRSNGARVLWPGEYELFATLGSATTSHEEEAAAAAAAVLAKAEGTEQSSEDDEQQHRVVGTAGRGGNVVHFGTILVQGPPRVVEAGFLGL